MICERFPSRHDVKRAISSTSCSTAQSPTIGNRCRPLGAGLREIRIWDSAGAFRAIYVAKFTDAIYVLHCFQKKTQKTSKADIDLAVKRYRDLMKELYQ
jgi:phage-related protein